MSFETDDLELSALLSAQAAMQLAMESATDPVARARYRGVGMDLQRDILRRVGVLTRAEAAKDRLVVQ